MLTVGEVARVEAAVPVGIGPGRVEHHAILAQRDDPAGLGRAAQRRVGGHTVGQAPAGVVRQRGVIAGLVLSSVKQKTPLPRLRAAGLKLFDTRLTALSNEESIY